MHTKIASALRRLERERRSGVFRTTADEAERSVLFDNGGIVAARSSVTDERLGEVMVRRGRITQRQLDDASILVRSRGNRLGDVLAELRIVPEGEIDAFVRAQLTGIASMLLREPPRKLEFRSDTSFSRVVETPVRVADAIMEAARHASREESMLDETLTPRLAPGANDALQQLHLESREAFVLSRCDGVSRVADIFAQIPLPEEDTARILLGLELAGIIEMTQRGTGH